MSDTEIDDDDNDSHFGHIVKFNKDDDNTLLPGAGDVELDEDDDSDGPTVISKPVRKVRRRKKSPVRRRSRSSIDDDDDDDDDFQSNGRGSPSAESRFRNRIDEDFDGLLTSLEFGTDNHKITVYRLEPTTDDDGERIAGMLDTFHNGLEIEDVKKKYGGGTYKLTIMGPKRSTGRGNEIKASKQVTIAGAPKVKGKKDSDTSNPLMITMLQNSKDDAERAHREAEKAREQMMQILSKDDTSKVMAPIVELFKSSVNSSGSAMTPIITMMQQQQAAAESRAEREAEARRREMDAAERRYESQLQAQQQRHEALMEQMKQDRERAAAELKFEREKFERQSELAGTEKNNMLLQVMQMQTSMESQNRQRDKEAQQSLFQMMQEGQKQSMSMAVQASNMQVGILTETLKDARNSQKEKGDFQETMENMTSLMTLQKTLMGGDQEDSRETWEKVLEKVGEMGPGLASAATGMFRGGGATRQGQPNQLQPKITPGTMIIVDDTAQASQQLPESTETKNKAENPSIEPEVVSDDSVANDFTKFNFPSDDGKDLMSGVTMLIKNIDFALRQNMEAEQVYTEVIEKFPKPVINLIYGASEDDLVTVVESNVPNDWPIMSPRGESVVRELYQILKEKHTV